MSNPMMKTFDYAFLSFLKHRVNGGMVLMVCSRAGNGDSQFRHGRKLTMPFGIIL